MCGICGIINLKPGPRAVPAELKSMMDVLAHRGPDASGLHIDDQWGFGHRRLSIIDLSDAGRQPMCNEDETVWLTYNGEFYNFADYLDELKRDGHQFRSHTDTEVIIHLYEKYGLAETLRRMNGMFAFGLWDKKKQTGYLVRDRFGIKPLYYYRDGSRLAFASEIKSFYTLRNFRPSLRTRKLPEIFLYSEAIDNSTLLENVFRVRPGTYVEIQGERVTECEYYDLANVPELPNISEAEALEEFDRLLGLSIRRQLISDVSLGVFLSGGVDSSILALKAAEIVGDPINTISVAYPEKSANEFFWSDQVAAKIKSHHHKFTVEAGDFFELYPWITYIHDGPATTGAAFFKAAQVAKPHCTVMLCGQGSDELFAGYSRYTYADYQVRLNRALAGFLPGTARRFLSDQLPRLGHHKIWRKVAARLALGDAEVAASYSGSLAREDFLSLLNGVGPKDYSDLLESYVSLFPAKPDTEFINKMLCAEMKSGLQRILQQTDRMTMAASVETRVPFLDHELVEFVFSLPVSLKVRDGVGKYLPKQYLLRYFPKEFVFRKKMGFPTPVFDWFKDPGNPIHACLNDSRDSAMNGAFNRNYLRQFVDRARSGRLGQTADILDPLMGYIAFNLWWKVTLESCSGSPPRPPPNS